jgi:hypothetical protein
MAGAPGGVAARIGVRVASALAAALVVAVVLVIGGVALVLLVGNSLGNQVDDAVRQAVTGTLTFYVLIAVPILIVVTGLVTFLFAGRALGAVESLRMRAAAAVDQGPGQPLAEPTAQDEVARLAETLDELVGRLDAAEGSRRRLVSSGAELRAPLATVAAGLDKIQRGQVDRAAIGPMRGEVERLARLLDALLGDRRPDEHADLGPPTEVTAPVPGTGPLPAVRRQPGPPPHRPDERGDPTTVITPLVRGPRDVRPMRDEDAREDPITAPRGIPVVRPGEGSGSWRGPNHPHQSGPNPAPGPNQPGPTPPPTNPRGVPVSDPRGAPPDSRRSSGQGR